MTGARKDKGVRKVRIAGGAAGAALLGVGLTLLPAFAQQGGSSPRLTFGVNQSFDVNDNLDLDVDSAGTTGQATTGLSFGLNSNTGISSLALNASTGLQFQNGPNTGDQTDFDLNTTRIGLAYDRAVANSSLAVGGVYTMDQIDSVLTLGSFPVGAGVPIDLSQLNGTGQRRFYGLNAALNYGLLDPVGYQLSAGFNGLDYANASDPTLFDSTRANLGLALLLRLSEVDQGRVGLSWGDFTSNDPSNPDSTDVGLDLGVTRTLPNGTVGFSVFASDSTDVGNSRAGFSLSRALQLPTGSLSGSIGATQLEDEDPEFTGGLNWQQNLPNGGISLGLTQALQNDSNNEPQYVTGLRLNYDHALNPLSQVAFGVGYALVDDTSSPDQTETADFRAVYSRSLTPDWALDVGYTYRQREEDSAGMARSNAVFLGLRRSWDVSP
jgi:hypothetical protein